MYSERYNLTQIPGLQPQTIVRNFLVEFGILEFTPRDKAICASYKFVGNFRSVGDQTSTSVLLGVYPN